MNGGLTGHAVTENSERVGRSRPFRNPFADRCREKGRLSQDGSIVVTRTDGDPKRWLQNSRTPGKTESTDIPCRAW